MDNHRTLTFQLTTDSYGQVKAIPLLMANDLNSELEQWFQNYKYTYLAINGLSEEEYSKPLQLEYTYSQRTLPTRTFEEIASAVTITTDLLIYHQLVKIIHKYVEVSYKIYMSLMQEKTGNTIIDFENHIKNLCMTFHKKNFPTKLETICNDLCLTDTLDSLTEINRVRNCLEHRAGVVSDIDCDRNKKYMSINFRYPQITTPDGKISPTSNIKGMQEHRIDFIDSKKKFKIGETIRFNFEENTQLIFSINACFKVIVDGIYNTLNVNQEDFETILRDIQ